jgi:uncharacterized protein YdhG (YjbR/CyaY superfamily)
MTEAAKVAAYIAKQPPAHRRILKRIRADLHAALPACEDYFSYRMPAVRSNGRLIAWYAGFRNHVSMFPMGPDVLKLAKVDASKYVTSKGTIQFPVEKPPSSALVKRLARAQLRKITAKARS